MLDIRCDYHLGMDPAFPLRIMDCRTRLKGMFLGMDTGQVIMVKKNMAKETESVVDYHFSYEDVFGMHNSGAAALYMFRYIFSEIYLIGFDLHRTAGKDYYFEDYFHSDSLVELYPQFKLIRHQDAKYTYDSEQYRIAGMSSLKKVAAMPGRAPVWNLAPGSMIDCFPFRNRIEEAA